MSRPKKSEQKDIRPLVLKKAQQLFIRYGYENITMRRIALEVGVSPAAIYLYFKNKDEIMDSLCNEGFRFLYREQQIAMQAPISDPLKKLAEMGRRYIRFGIQNKDYYEIMFLMPAPEKPKKIGLPQEENTYGEKSLGCLRTVIQECFDYGYFKSADPETVCVAMWSLVHGMVSLTIRNQMPVPLEHFEAFAGVTVDFFLSRFER